MTDELVSVFVTGSDVESLMYRSLLQEAGIDVFERTPARYSHTSIYESGRPPEYKLYVRAEDAERAARLLGDFQAQAESGVLQETLPADDDIVATRADRRPHGFGISRYQLILLIVLACVLLPLILRIRQVLGW